jgi:hypothetical protein
MKICAFVTEEEAKECMTIYQKAFIQRFTKMVYEYSNNSTDTEQFTINIKRLTHLERELFDLQKTQRTYFSVWKNKEGPKVEFNKDMI